MSMTSYVALLDGGKRQEAIGVEQVEPGVYLVRVRGHTHRVDAYPHDAGTFSLLVDTESYTVTLDPRATAVHVRVRDNLYPIDVLDERRLRMRRAAPRLHADGRQVVAAPLAGKVLRLLARAGDAVRAGQPLAVVAFLGMENELRSPKDGKVLAVHAEEGQAVERGASLATVE